MRVVALTLDPSLGAALNMLDDWEITSARDVDGVVDVARGAQIVLIGVGGTEEGLDIAQQIHSRGVTIPSLVVGEGPVPSSPFAPVVLRPFSLDDLRGAVASAIEGAPLVSSAPEPPPARAPEPHEDHVNEPDTVVVELRPKETSSDAEAKIDTKPEAPAAKAAPGQSARAKQAAVTPPPAAPRAAQKEQAGEIPSEDERNELRKRLTTPRPHLPARPAEAPPKETRRAPEPAPSRRRGLGRRAAAAAAQAESPFIQRLRTGATAARDIERLIEELPQVADVLAMAQAFLSEAVTAFSPQIASVYWHEPGSFRIVASHGLSRVEQGLIVQDAHPLFAQVLLSSDPVLIAPVDLARGLVSGVAGARTEALIVGPVHVDGECIAALVIGRQDFSDDDLDRMDVLAREAGPGLALARALESLRAKY